MEDVDCDRFSVAKDANSASHPVAKVLDYVSPSVAEEMLGSVSPSLMNELESASGVDVEEVDWAYGVDVEELDLASGS